MEHKVNLAQDNAYAVARVIATSISNRLTEAHPTGSSICDQEARDMLNTLNLFMASNLFLPATFNFGFRLEYPGLQIGRPSGCQCRRRRAFAENGAGSGNDTECPQNSTTTSSNAPVTSTWNTSSTPTTSSSTTAASSSAAAASSTAAAASSTAAAASSTAAVPPTWNTSCVASGVFSDTTCPAGTCPAGADGVQRCLFM
jgi:hypothetical protein